MNLKTIQEKAEYYSFLHKQNLNGRESEDELFELGIQVGIEETEQLQDEFAIGFAEWFSDNTLRVDLDAYKTFGDNDETKPHTIKKLLEIYKNRKV